MLAGDTEQFRALVRLYEGPVFAVIRSFFGTSHVVDDLAQDAFLTALERLHQFDPSRGMFRTWLLAIARNKCRDALRRKQPVATNMDFALLSPPKAELVSPVDDAEQVLLDTALGSLSPEHRIVFLLTQVYGLPLREVAALENVAEGTIKSRLSRARAVLRAALTSQSRTKSQASTESPS